jgi:hypothetical protein
MDPRPDSAARFDAAAVCAELQLPDAFLTWLSRVERPAESPGPVLPSDADATTLLRQLAVEPGDRVAALAARPNPITHPALWWVLDRAYHDVIATMGIPPAWGGWPEFLARTGPVGRHLYVWLCLAVLPHVRGYHERLGIAEDVSWASLANLGREMTKVRRLSGIPGLESSWMLPRTFRGAAYRLGRLVFERGQPQPEHSQHEVLRPGEISLGTHIPDTGGHLDPDSCDDSFSTAQDFFAHHFDEQPVAFDCHSWLMDDQLAEHLPATSNIIQFQRRFTYFNDSEPGDHEILEHVFHRRYHEPQAPMHLLDELPQDTRLQRAIAAHLRAGGHWQNRTGWLTV